MAFRSVCLYLCWNGWNMLITVPVYSLRLSVRLECLSVCARERGGDNVSDNVAVFSPEQTERFFCTLFLEQQLKCTCWSRLPRWLPFSRVSGAQKQRKQIMSKNVPAFCFIFRSTRIYFILFFACLLTRF